MKKTTYIAGIASILIPSVSFAQLDGVRGLLLSFQSLLGLLIPLIFGLSIIYFFWGVAQFILHAGEEKARKEGQTKMLWGVIALFVMVSIYGILHFIGWTVGIPFQTNPESGSPGFNDTFESLGECTSNPEFCD